MDPFDMCIIISAVSFFLGLVSVYCVFGRHFTDYSREDIPYVIATSIFDSAKYLTVVFLLNHLPLFLINIVSNTAPLIASILAYFVLSESIGTIQMIGLVGSLVGVVIIATSKVSNKIDSTTFSNK